MAKKIKGKIAIHKDTAGMKIFVMPSHDFTYKADDKVYAVFRDDTKTKPESEPDTKTKTKTKPKSPVLHEMTKRGDEHYCKLEGADIDITTLTHAAVARVDVCLITDDKCVNIIGYEIPALS